MEKNWLRHPLLRRLHLDSESYFIAQRQVLRQKKFLRRIYCDFYQLIKNHLPDTCDRVIELGSGAGFIEEVIPQAVRTDVFFHPYAQLILNGIYPPLEDDSLDAVVFLNVFHHIPDVLTLLESVGRVLKPGGRIVMIEPWVSSWSKIIYTRLHREPLDWRSERWGFESSGPVSGANQALPWIVIKRDQQIFEREFPNLKLIKIQPMMPLRYLLSGGAFSWLGFPEFLYEPVTRFEMLFRNLEKWAMFALIVIEKVR